MTVIMIIRACLNRSQLSCRFIFPGRAGFQMRVTAADFGFLFIFSIAWDAIRCTKIHLALFSRPVHDLRDYISTDSYPIAQLHYFR
jgi:hypothetical protein